MLPTRRLDRVFIEGKGTYKRVSNPEGEEQNSEAKKEWLRLARISGYLTIVGFQMAIVVGAGTFLGDWLDKKMDTGGLMTILGGTVGFGVSLFLVVRTLKRL